MSTSFVLWCCYRYLCEAYDRQLGGNRVLLQHALSRAKSMRNAQVRRRELLSVYGGAFPSRDAYGATFEEIAFIAATSPFLRWHFGPVGEVRETLWGRVDEIGRVAFKPQAVDTNPCGELLLPSTYIIPGGTI